MADTQNTFDRVHGTLVGIVSFDARERPDGFWDVLAFDRHHQEYGFIFAERMKEEHAVWTATLLNAAQPGIRLPGLLNEVADLHDIVRKLNMRLARLEKDDAS